MDTTAPATADLLAALRRDKDKTFAELVASHHAKLLAVARSFLKDGEAEEAVQEAWISAYKAIDKFQGRSSIRTWLTRIVINEAKMRLRKAGRESTINFSSVDPDVMAGRFREDCSWQEPPVRWEFRTPEELLQEENLVECIQKVLASLPVNQRLVMELRDIQGLEFGDICNLLDVTASNIRVLLHRARTQMFTMLERYQETGQC